LQGASNTIHEPSWPTLGTSRRLWFRGKNTVSYAFLFAALYRPECHWELGPTRVPNSSVRAADDRYPVTMPDVSIPQTTTEPQLESPYDNARARWDGTINSAESHSATLGPDDLRPIVDTRPSFYRQSSDWNILPTKPAEENLAEIPRESACSPKEGGTVIRLNEAALTNIISTSDFEQRTTVNPSTIATTETQNFADGLYPVEGHDPHPTDQTSYYNEYLRGISWIDPWITDNMPNSIFSSSSLLANIPEAVSEPTLYESGEVRRSANIRIVCAPARLIKSTH